MCIYKYDISHELRRDFQKKLNLNGSIIYSIVMISLLTLIVMLIISLLLSTKEAAMGGFIMLGGSMAIVTSFKRRNHIIKEILSSNKISIDKKSITFYVDDTIIKKWNKINIKVIENTDAVTYLSYLGKDGYVDKMAIPLLDNDCLSDLKHITENI